MEHTTRTTARARRQEREAREIKAEVDARRSADARRRPIAAKLAETLSAASARRVAEITDGSYRSDPRLTLLDYEWRSAVALLEAGACAPDVSEADARDVLARCGLLPADAVPASAGAPESLAGAPVPPSRMCCCGRLAERGSERCAECASDDFLRSFGPYRRCSRCQVRAALLGGLCAECGDAEADDFALECRATTGGATPPGSPVMYDAVIPAGGGDPIYCQSPEQAETVAAALNAYRGAVATTSSASNAEPADPTKAEVEIHGRRVALYLVRGPDGRERWISEPISPKPRTSASSVYQIALIAPHWPDPDDECIGRTMPLGTIPARHRKHAENRARKLGARLL